tara:strand:+ start:400 stop:1554 length:1155 start_codon:yes stop_codon:yes gene_type:complete
MNFPRAALQLPSSGGTGGITTDTIKAEFCMNKMALAASLLMALVACAAPDPAEVPVKQPTSASALWSFDTAVRSIRDESCPGGPLKTDPMPIRIGAASIDLKDAGASPVLPATVTFVGGWHLTSGNANFGGLSGMEILPDGDLLTISDVGAFVWIGLSNGGPDGTGKLAYMHGQDGAHLSGKSEGDAEGLAFRDGVALVSFERNHRIEAFDLANCGANVRAVPVARLPFDLDGKSIGENQGAEALSILPAGTLKFGLESFGGGPSPMGSVLSSGQGFFTGATATNPRGYSLVGLDETTDPIGQPVTVTLYRSYDPIRGNRNIITWSTSDIQIELKRPMTVDNFEGIAAEFLDADTLRIWLVSDNNFSERQQTLLYVFDIDTRTE